MHRPGDGGGFEGSHCGNIGGIAVGDRRGEGGKED